MVEVKAWRELALLDVLPQAILLFGEDKTLLLANRAATALLGRTQSELFGQAFDQLFPQEEMARLLNHPHSADYTRIFLMYDERFFQPQLLPLPASQEAQGGGFIVVLSEVSHFKRLNENMTLFLQTVSHDLRSPLTAAKGFVDMLSMVGELNQKQIIMREKILVSISDMTNLVEKVLDAGRLDPEMGAYELRRELCDPAEVVEKVVSHMSATATKKDQALSPAIGPGLPMLSLDHMMIERALVNLVENAIKYTPNGGEIQVAAYVQGENLYFEVRDNGLGIAPELQVKLFERGSRIRRVEHRNIRGSGLGLFIVKNVAQQHGGDAEVDSVEGQGSRFRIRIPLSGPNIIGNSHADSGSA
jgi:two-component system phosphate regulon sensor histidine kinase PhoR